MHPILTRPVYFFAYLSAWVPLGAMIAMLVSISARLVSSETIALVAPMTLVFAYTCLSPWYLCRSFPLRTTPLWKLFTHHTLAALLCSSAIIVLGRCLALLLSGMFPKLDVRFSAAVPVCAAVLFLIYELSIALHYVYLALQSSREAQVLAREAELRALRSQVNPHFLFNSLHSISALTTADPAKAREMCVRLSDYLRRSLKLGDRDAIPFDEELDLAEHYLDVEQVRFGKRLRVVRQIDPSCADCEAPPLLVQPLVENAVKHGISTLIEGGEITMTSRCAEGRMSFTVENPYDPDSRSARSNGIGLANVRNRLRARYGNAGALEIDSSDGRYRATLSFPCGHRA